MLKHFWSFRFHLIVFFLNEISDVHEITSQPTLNQPLQSWNSTNISILYMILHVKWYLSGCRALHLVSMDPSERSATNGCTIPAATKRERMSSEVLSFAKFGINDKDIWWKAVKNVENIIKKKKKGTTGLSWTNHHSCTIVDPNPPCQVAEYYPTTRPRALLLPLCPKSCLAPERIAPGGLSLEKKRMLRSQTFWGFKGHDFKRSFEQ